MHLSTDRGPSRRAFLQTAGVTALGLTPLAGALAAPVPQGGGQKPDPFGGFTVGIQSYSFRNFKLEQALERTRALGLRYVELSRGHVPLTSTAAQIKAVLGLCKQYNITPVAFGVERFTKNHNENRQKFEFARSLGLRSLTADPDPDSFASLDKLVAEFNISIAIHPHGPSGKNLHRWYNAETILTAVQKHHRLIGTCLDTGHLIRAAQAPFNRKIDPAQQIRHMGARNFGLHLKDHDNAKRTDVIFGKGVLNVRQVIAALARSSSRASSASNTRPTPTTRRRTFAPAWMCSARRCGPVERVPDGEPERQ